MRTTLLFLSLLVAAGCDSNPPTDIDAGDTPDAGGSDAGTDAGPPAGPASVLYDPGSDGFFDTPFPSDLRTDATGSPDLSGFPNSRAIVADGIELLAGERPGFSPLTSVYFRFTGPLDESALPAPADVDEASSPIVLIDVDPDSPELGRRFPAHVSFHAASTRFFSANTLTVRPVPGIDLHPGRTYAVAILDGLLASDGSAVTPNDAFDALKGGADAHYATLFDALEGQGISRDDVLVAAMFTTSDPATELDTARAWIHAQDLPMVVDWARAGQTPRVASYTAAFETYELMSGEPPYMQFGDTVIRFDDAGEPEVVNRRRVEIGISVPVGDAPAEGIPIVLYGHGTGGDEGSHLRGEGPGLADVGWAAIGFEAALHGQRFEDGFMVENLLTSNPVAAREVVRQTVIDMLLMFRMLAEGAFTIPAEITGDAAIAFDTSRVAYMGHSQGAQEGAVLLGVEPTLQAAFLSAGGEAGVISVVDRELRPGTTIACLLAALVMEDCDVMLEDHPVISLLVQPVLDPADPPAYNHRVLRERPDGWAAPSIAMTEGLEDAFTSPRGIEALAVAIGLPIVEPVAQMTLPYELSGLGSLAPPVSANLSVGGVMTTGGVMQFPEDGHFAIYRNEDAENRYLRFFESLLADGVPTLVGPM